MYCLGQFYVVNQGYVNSDKIFMFDVSKYMWVTRFDPSSRTSYNSPTPSAGSSSSQMTDGIIGGFAVVIFCLFAMYFLYHRSKKNTRR